MSSKRRNFTPGFLAEAVTLATATELGGPISTAARCSAETAVFDFYFVMTSSVVIQRHLPFRACGAQRVETNAPFRRQFLGT